MFLLSKQLYNSHATLEVTITKCKFISFESPSTYCPPHSVRLCPLALHALRQALLPEQATFLERTRSGSQMTYSQPSPGFHLMELQPARAAPVVPNPAPLGAGQHFPLLPSRHPAGFSMTQTLPRSTVASMTAPVCE